MAVKFAYCCHIQYNVGYQGASIFAKLDFYWTIIRVGYQQENIEVRIGASLALCSILLDVKISALNEDMTATIRLLIATLESSLQGIGIEGQSDIARNLLLALQQVVEYRPDVFSGCAEELLCTLLKYSCDEYLQSKSSHANSESENLRSIVFDLYTDLVSSKLTDFYRADCERAIGVCLQMMTKVDAGKKYNNDKFLEDQYKRLSPIGDVGVFDDSFALCEEVSDETELISKAAYQNLAKIVEILNSKVLGFDIWNIIIIVIFIFHCY